MNRLGTLLGQPWWALAHRGDKLNHPENRPAALDSALDAGVVGIETDLRLSADGRVVIEHDPFVIVGSRRRRLAETRGEELCELGLLDLECLLDRWAGRTTLLLELKTEGEVADRVDRLVDAVVESLSQARPEWRCAVLAFEQRVLKRLAELLPDLALIHNLHRPPLRLEAALDLGHRQVDGIDLAIDRWTPHLRDQTRRHGEVALLAWGVNDDTTLQQGLELGLDGMMSDAPHWLTARRAE